MAIGEVFGHRAIVSRDNSSFHGGGFHQGIVVALQFRGADIGINRLVELSHLRQFELAIHVAAIDEFHTLQIAERLDDLFEALGGIHAIASPTDAKLLFG